MTTTTTQTSPTVEALRDEVLQAERERRGDPTLERTPQGYIAPADVAQRAREGQTAAELALAEISDRKAKVMGPFLTSPQPAPEPTPRAAKLSEDGFLDHWRFREGVTGVIGYFNGEVRYLVHHRQGGNCLKGYEGEVRSMEYAQQEYELQVELDKRKRAGDEDARRSSWFCTRCLVQYRTATEAVSQMRATVEDGVNRVLESNREEPQPRHGEPCPTCQVELPLTGQCPTCSDAPAVSVTQPSLVDQVKAYAAEPEHYNAGWDLVVEAMTDDEIATELGKVTTLKSAIRKLRPLVETKKEQFDAVTNA
jgi:hypothetical protein